MLSTATKEKNEVIRLLGIADIQIDGSRPWDIDVHDDSFYEQLLYRQNLGLGETYMDGLWDCQRVDEMIDKLISARLDEHAKVNPRVAVKYVLNKLLNYQTKSRSKIVAHKHYNIGNDLFKAMLDKETIYSCGYWQNASTLDEAQQDKMKLICDKLQLQPGMTLLDIGCGWGGLAKFAAEHYGVQVTGITISEEQKKLADVRCKGFPITIKLQDYRDLTGSFDRVVSVGMFEHVGYKNYRQYMTVAHRCLAEDGLFLLHTIGSNHSNYGSDPWLDKYIFPNSMLPSITQISNAISHLFTMEDWHNFGADYDKTLMAWHHNFNKHWNELKKNYDERFYRMWNYYLLSCAGMFRSRCIQLWQVVLSKNGVRGGYHFRYKGKGT